MFCVAAVAVNAPPSVTFAVAPEDTCRASPLTRPVTVSVSRFTWKVSLPAPPTKVSLPAPPVKVSLPAPPVKVLLPLFPVIITSLLCPEALALILTFPPILRIETSAPSAKLTVFVYVFSTTTVKLFVSTVDEFGRITSLPMYKISPGWATCP